MCEQLLNDLLSEVLDVELVVKWLENETIEEHEKKIIYDYECSQAEFILYFLNYLHEATAGILQSFSTQATPHRIRTPRRIESFSSKSSNPNFKKSNSRRTALFPEKNKSQNDPYLGVSSLETETKDSSSTSQSTSTPRTNKNRHSLSDLDSINSISPIIKNKNGFSKSITPRASKLDSNMCLGDFIIQKRIPTKKKSQKQLSISRESNDSLNQSNDKPNLENCLNLSNIESSFNSISGSINKHCSAERLSQNTPSTINKRRINPTNLSQGSNSFSSKRITSTDSRNSFSFQTISETELPRKNISEREILQEERLKIICRSKVESDNKPHSLTPRQVRSQQMCSIKPSLESVTFKLQLDILAQIYSILFDLNLVLNPLSEIYFLLTLILLQVQKSDEQSDQKLEELRITLENSLTDLEDNYENIFKSVHNCVYFAAIVLNKQRAFLSALDRASLKLLEENARLKSFTPELSEELVIYHSRKIEKKIDNHVVNSGENVSFISDTDNRENFPSDSCFHTFRKQRDLFYELLHIWENNHLQPGWTFAGTFSTKIRALIFMHSDPINSVHLARLFKNQLLNETSQNYDNAPLPSGLNNVDAEKLNRLRDRLISKKSMGGPSPEPAFPGRQEFFKDFILTSYSPGFHKHLIDCFVAEIVQLDDIGISFSDVDETDAVVDQETRTLYHNSLKSLKILAKFLGFLDTLPYKSDLPLNNQILTSQIALRRHFVPSIDIANLVKLALHNSKLILTVPWIADYLAMLDHVSLRLPYFSELIEILYEIHYNFNTLFPGKSEKILLIKLSLGWLFERPNFPLDNYQQWISKKYQNNCTEIALNSLNSCIDNLDLVDETILFICCPYLYEIRNLMSSDPSNSNVNKSVKYIRPISTVIDNTDNSNKRLQKQMEDAFFNSQPSSTKKTIDFVSERVTSVCAKHICNNLVPNAKLELLIKFQEHLDHVKSLTDPQELQRQLNLCCKKRAKELSDQCFEEFNKNTKDEIVKFAAERCENSLIALLAEDIHPVTRKTCISLAIHQTTERVAQWFSSHVNPGIFLKELLAEMENVQQGTSHNKKITYRLPARGKNVEHDPDAKSPVKLMTDIREVMFIIHDNSKEVKIENLEQILLDTSVTCKKRCDLNPVAQYTICRMFYDMFFMLAANRPDLAKEPSYLDTLISFWEVNIHKSERENFFDRIFCPRNVCMFEKSIQPDKTWKACELFIIKLMRRKVLKADNFEKQTMAMFKHEWQSNIQRFTSCVQNVVDDYVKNNGSQENFTYILSWIADYCNDDEFF